MSVSKTKSKEDAVQKLKEIKQRQQNWLKQREQSKNKEGPRQKIASAPSSSKAKEGSKLSISNKGVNKPAQREPEVQTRFKKWINSKENEANEKEEASFDDCLSIRSGVETELARLVTPEQPVAEEEFNDLADRIANKVKNNLGLSHSHSLSSSARTESTEISELSNDEQLLWNSEKCKTFTCDTSSFNLFGTSGLSSHNCIICKKLMLSSRNIPMMIIPCGHTLCKACSDRRQSCPSCDCAIMSFTVNIMLQQVIQEYHSNPHHGATVSTAHKHVREGVGEKQKQDYVEDNRRNRMASYTSQLANLRTRHDILSSEQNTLLDKQRYLSTEIRQNEAQAASVKKQEQEIEKAILDLQDKLQGLREHGDHFQGHVDELKDEKSKVDAKVSMLTNTISSLVREIEKVALLAENEN